MPTDFIFYDESDVYKQNFRLALEIQSELIQLIKPVTPETIYLSKFRNNWALKVVIGVGSLSLIGLFISLFVQTVPETVQIVASSGVGISFHLLYTANRYLKTSTFGPKYMQRYLISLGLGLLSGTILGVFGKDLLGSSLDPSGLVLTSNLLALVGGFSVEAVASILKRISEILVAAISGSTDDRASIEAEKKINSAKSKMAEKVADILSESSNYQDLRKKSEDLLKEILK